MIKFKTLTMQNFLSYGNVPTTVDFDRPGTTLILGENLDNTAAGSGNNGVGKTAIINALTYAIYDEPISKISLDNLVNHINKRNMEVAVTFEMNGNEYQIIRNRKTKAGAAGNTVRLLINGEDKTPDSVANTNKLIVQIIGIPYDLFVRIVAFSATLTPFLDLPSRHASQANQTDIIEELFDLKTLSEKAELLKSKISETESSIKIHTTRVEQMEKEQERHNKQVENAKMRVTAWEQKRKTDLETLREDLTQVEDIDVDGQRKLLTALQAILAEKKEKQAEIRTISAELTSLEHQLGSKKKVKQQIAAQIKTLESAKLTAKTELAQLRNHVCPTCKQDFKDVKEESEARLHIIEAADKELDTLDLDARAVEIEIKKLVEQTDSVGATISTLREEVREYEKQEAKISKNLMFSSFDELLQASGTASNLLAKINELSTATNPHEESLAELLESGPEPIDMTEINNLVTLLEHQKFLLKLLTKKDSFVRKALLNKSIPFLNSRLAHYLSELGLPHTVEFTHEMTAHITQFGRPMDFGNLSNGQRARVNIALSFAFRDVLQSMSNKINVCLLDEVLDVGLDTIGVQAAARMLKRKARDEGLSLFIISHRDEIDSAFDRKMMIQMSKGFSYIALDEK